MLLNNESRPFSLNLLVYTSHNDLHREDGWFKVKWSVPHSKRQEKKEKKRWQVIDAEMCP